MSVKKKKCKKCNVLCLPREHQGVHKNSFRNVRAFKDRIGIWEMLVFEERRKPEYLEKNLSEQRREPTTNSTHIWRRVRNMNSLYYFKLQIKKRRFTTLMADAGCKNCYFFSYYYCCCCCCYCYYYCYYYYYYYYLLEWWQNTNFSSSPLVTGMLKP